MVKFFELPCSAHKLQAPASIKCSSHDDESQTTRLNPASNGGVHHLNTAIAKKPTETAAADRPPQVPAPIVTQPRSVFIGLNRQTGGLMAFAPDGDFELFVDDTLVNIGFNTLKTIQTDRINRICDSTLAETPLHWRVSMAEDAPAIGKNVSADWRLNDGNTAYLRSLAGPEERPVSAFFRCPIEGADLSVFPGDVYTFQASFAVHRAAGKIRFHFKSASGEVIHALEADIDTVAQGGTNLANYVSRHLSAKAPEGAAALSIEIIKSVTNKDEKDSYLFFTRPALTKSAFVGFEHLRHDLPESWTVNAFRTRKSVLCSCDIPIPDIAMDGSKHRITIRHRPSGDSASVPVFLPSSVNIPGQIFGLEGSSMVAHVGTPNPVCVALWCDGQPTGTTADSEAGTGRLRIPLPLSVCDGSPHLFELRRTVTGQLLGQFACIGPMSITPWQSLQKYAGSPLPAHLSPLSAYRQLSLASDVAPSSTVPMHELHSILLEGFEKPRRQFRILPFPVVDKPDVSIVIPVHNKFDVTYLCLAAILFAASRATFEVIVVDDGSSDTTTKLPEIAPGTVYVRNETALGFVGACNAGAEKARGHYICFLNNDTEPTAHYLDELIFAFENFEDVGLAGSKLIYPDGQLQEAGGIVWGSGDPWNYGRRANPFDPRYNYARVCDYVSGAAIMLPRTLWEEIGGFSREFMPAYFEDTDLAFKVKNAGKKVVYVPQSVVVHYEGMSNGTDQTASSGLKRYQEINRPKFKKKWASLFGGNGKTGENVDLAKDRGISKRVLFLDYEVPQLDRDAGSYAAIQEIRMFQALGCEITFVPLNMAYMGRHTEFLQRMGVETVYMPFSAGIASFLQARGKEFDLVYITRYGVAEQTMNLVREHAPQARRVINVADLHFLRQIRDAIAGGDQEKMSAALLTRDAEIAALSSAELILSYSAVEQTVITSHITHGPKAGIVPWVIDTVSLRKTFSERRDIAFMGGFGHYPNIAAVKYFVSDVMPLLRVALPGVRFLVYGSNVPPDIEALACNDVVIKGYVADVAELFDSCRVFVAPLLTGAGMKGKVLDCIAAGIPSVLSPIAAEGIGLRDGMDSIIARKPGEWVEGIARLYKNEEAWYAMSASVHEFAHRYYSFEGGVAVLNDMLASIEFFSHTHSAVCATSARPVSPRHLPAVSAARHVAAVAVRKP